MSILIKVSDVHVSATHDDEVVLTNLSFEFNTFISQLREQPKRMQELILAGLTANYRTDFPELKNAIIEALIGIGNIVDVDEEHVIETNWSNWTSSDDVSIMLSRGDVELDIAVPNFDITTLSPYDLENHENVIDETVYERSAEYLSKHYPNLDIDDYDYQLETVISEISQNVPSFEALKELVVTHNVTLSDGRLITDVNQAGSAIVAELKDDEPRIIKLTDRFKIVK
jgi:hypothetical protein